MERVRSILVASLLAGSACAVTPLRADVAAHGNLTAEVKATDGAGRTRRRGRALPQVILFEARAVRALDPRTAKELWVRPMAVNAHGAVTADLVLVPVVGPRLVALDRRNGEVVWLSDLPGEVIVGMGASDRYAAVAVAGRRFRFQHQDFGRIALVDLSDGTVRWARRSRARLGTPAVRGARVFVPVGPSVVALSVRTGREVARSGVPVETRRVEVARGTVLAGSGRAWVDLESARYRRLGVSGADAAVLPSEVLDLGPADDERLRWWVRATEDGSTPREGVLLARGAVVAVRFDAEGRPDRIHWIHNARDHLEYVAMHVGRRRVVLVREDGAIVQLDTADGSEVDAIAGGPPVRGALFADLEPDDAPVRLSRPDPDKVVARARGLLARNDPRLLPAQRLVLETLWRDDAARHRAVVTELAHGVPPVPGARVDGALRQVALDLVARPWGKGSAEARRALAQQLRAAATPGAEGTDDGGGVVTLVRRAVAEGDPSLVAPIAALLESPHLTADEVAEVARALADLDRPEAVPAAAAFVLRYHADPRVVVESRAMEHLADFLLRRAELGDPQAAAAIEAVERDPLTDRSLLAYIAARRPREVAVATASHERTRSESAPPALPSPDL